MWPVSRTIDRFDTTFDHDGLISNAGLIVTATLMVRLGLEQLTTAWVCRPPVAWDHLMRVPPA